MKRAGDRDLDRLVAEVLRTLAGCEPDTRWQAQLRDLRRILAADYNRTIRTFHRSGNFPVRELLREAQHDFPGLNEQPAHFDAAARERLAKLGIRVRMQEYAQRTLRGFYHRDPECGPLIWVNLAHPPGGVAASLGHEVGHWYREQLLGFAGEHTTVGFFNSDFAGHLARPDELFADVFTVLAAYPKEIAAKIFPRGGWRALVRRAAQFDLTPLTRVRDHLAAVYHFDMMNETPTLPVPHRIYYTASMVHFARLRWALLQEFDL